MHTRETSRDGYTLNEAYVPWRLTRRGRLVMAAGALIASAGIALGAGARPGPIIHSIGVRAGVIQPEKSPAICDITVTNQYATAWAIGQKVLGREGDPRDFIDSAADTHGNGDLARLQPGERIYMDFAMCSAAFEHNVPVDFIR